ncbi:DNA-binding protein [Candidatus Bipolaricaulota bacterium]|nr:DNA-binding protein [Candidatus Bipolaricaulota bacterium]
MESVCHEDRIFARLERGEEILSCLKELRDEYDIENGFIQGIGAVDEVKLGNYNVEKEKYREREFEGTFEVPSFSGNIGPDKIHTHITLSDPSFNPKAGHCGMARVSGTFELIILTTPDKPLYHQFDPATGLDVFDFSF